MKIVIGTQNKRKIDTVKVVIQQILPNEEIEILPYPAKSGVSETPWDNETYDGAKNRALDCISNINNADYFLGLESGLVERYGQIYEEAWACIINSDDKEFFGYSSGLKVPDYIIGKMKDTKMEHWQVMKVLEEEHSLSKDDTWGNYSKEMIIRDISLQEAVRNAFVQIFAPQDSFYHK